MTLENKTRCPLCGHENGCQNMPQNRGGDCWCFIANIPKPLLEKVPESERRRSCICRHCVDAYKAEKGIS
ncbi:MAG: cysteine-rich CWC family protein [Motiliproteus sp.]